VHFYSIFGRKMRWNRASPHTSRRRRAATSRRVAPTSASGLTGACTRGGQLLPQVLRAPRPSESVSPLRGASGVVDGRVLPLPTGPSAAPPRSRAPVAVWGDTPASTSASAQLEVVTPIYRAGFSPEAEQTAPSASPPVQRRRASPEPAAT
jgi:hypothetical protein